MSKSILNTEHSSLTDIALLLLRVAIAVWMLSKGLPKVAMLFLGNVTFPGVLGMSPTVSLSLTVFAQVICSALLLVGLFTRFAALVLTINMLVAVLVAHANDPFAKAEPALHFLLVYCIILLVGAGKYSLDYVLTKDKKN